MEQQVPVSQQIESLRQQLLQAYVHRDEAEKLKQQAEEKITALRNVFAGIGLGQQASEQAAASVPAQPRDFEQRPTP